MICPHCETELAPEDIKRLWGQYTTTLRKHRTGGPGRPRTKKRCACGAMTVARAKQRNHKCSAPAAHKAKVN